MKKVSKKKSSSPALTKADLSGFESRLMKHMDIKVTTLRSELKSDISQSELKLSSQISDSKSELIRYIDLKHEQLLYDFRGIFADKTSQQNDRIDNHEHRIQRIEHKVMAA
ncbi:hypothetical protein EXS65_03030 [Candidatus Peribacteria bacterium]|nr:hypothetical protein [Candidatus Peribacteria bacterium]